jgi:mannose-6-phosphate isomerase-like protein (cupin superfamily)
MNKFHINLDNLQEFEAPPPYTRTMKIIFDGTSDPSCHFSAGQFRLKPGQKGPAHKHEKEIEIYIVLQGKGKITFNNETIFPLSPKDMVYVPPKTLHETVNTGNDDLMFYGIFIPPVNLSEITASWTKL